MAFDYGKFKQHSEGGSYWTSYSDLFMGLSVVFLLLYVTTSLRSGTSGIQQQLEHQKLTLEVQDLRNQLKMYDSVKKDYLTQKASQDEQQQYEELMDKLTLLQEEAKNEKNRLNKAAMDNQKKEQALNQYQQMVRNIINANMVAKTKINKRDLLINEQDQELTEQADQISDLQKDVQEKSNRISQTQSELKSKEKLIDQKVEEIKSLYKQNKLSKEQFAKQLAQVKGEGEKQLGELQGALAEKEGILRETQGQLAKAKAEIDARKNVAKDIAKEFEKAGVKADIDMGTGEVIIDFGGAYFENDSAKIKTLMADILKKAMPAYAKSLMGNPKVAKNISAIEIIGFASPTYQGRYVDPNSLDPNDRKALNYNMDLSYSRAKSIMQYIFDQNNMEFKHQREMLPLVKVSGRSFLDEAKAKRTISSDENFCKKYDCKKAQKVIIRFGMDAKR